jgi:hypothetical protein
MNITRTFLALSLAGACATGLGTRAAAGVFTDNIDMLAVAEQMQAAPSSQGNPVSYVAFDGGYIEAGDPIAGKGPPSADQVSKSLNAALADHGFRANQVTPDIVLTYHWGILRVDHTQIRLPYGIKTNLRARIELVSTEKLGSEVENHILLREKGNGANDNFSSPRILAGQLETVVQDSKYPRYFVVVSAYDYQALAHHEARLLWRTKLSALETSGPMDEVIPALIASGGPFFGKNFTDLKNVTAPLSKPAQLAMAAVYAPPAPESLQLDKHFIDGLLKSERVKVSGVAD